MRDDGTRDVDRHVRPGESLSQWVRRMSEADGGNDGGGEVGDEVGRMGLEAQRRATAHARARGRL